MAQGTRARKSPRAAAAPSPRTQQQEAVSSKFWEGIGRRKTASARVRIREGKGSGFTVNGKSLQEYFQEEELSETAKQPLSSAERSFDVSAVVEGGGKHAQAEAVRHGLARALVEENGELRPQLKALGFLKRDPRERERQKFGLKRARRARQWRKR